jgi:hypothetical protein
MQQYNVNTQLLQLTADEVHDDGALCIKRYDCNFDVTTAGDGLWGGEAGRKVHITQVTVIDNVSDDFTWRQVNVEHDTTWDIYTDGGFEAAISDAVGFAVQFTEQGMQEDNYASMEAGE